MSKRFTDTETYDDPWYQELSLAHKCFWKFITEKCDAAGVWKVNLRLASFLIGAEFERAEILAAFDGRIEEHLEGYWFLPGFIEFQYGTLSPSCNPHKAILKSVAKHTEKGSIPEGFLNPSATLPKTPPKRVPKTLEVQVQEKEKDKEQVQDQVLDPNALARKIANLVPDWSPHLNGGEHHLLLDNLPKWQSLTDDDWSILTAWYADKSDRSQYRLKSKVKLIETVDQELAKAREAGFTAESKPRTAAGPDWLPDDWRDIAERITGQPADSFDKWTDVPQKHRYPFEKACRGLETPDAA